MKDVFVLLNNNIRELFRQTSFWIGVIIVLQVLMIWLIIYVYLELSDSNYHFYILYEYKNKYGKYTPCQD